MPGVAFESDRVWHLHRHGPDLHFNSQFTQCRHERRIKIRHGSRLQFNRLLAASAGLNDRQMLEEIELHFEDAVFIRDGRGSQTARSHVKRNLPPMVDARTQCQPDFAGNLRPHVERVVGVLPGCQRQLRPGFFVGACFVGACDVRRHQEPREKKVTNNSRTSVFRLVSRKMDAAPKSTLQPDSGLLLRGQIFLLNRSHHYVVRIHHLVEMNLPYL